MSAPVTPRIALQVIRTWAAFEIDHPDMYVLVPAHVMKLCDEALGIVPTPNTTEQGGAGK